MGSVLIAFLAICISCAVVLAGASFLYRFLAALPRQQRAATVERVVPAPTRVALSACVSQLRLWLRARRASRPHRRYTGAAATRQHAQQG